MKPNCHYSSTKTDPGLANLIGLIYITHGSVQPNRRGYGSLRPGPKQGNRSAPVNLSRLRNEEIFPMRLNTNERSCL